MGELGKAWLKGGGCVRLSLACLRGDTHLKWVALNFCVCEVVPPSLLLSLLHCSGFSGTPSDLLPRELRPCMVEPGSDAAMVRLLSSAHYVSHTLVQDWTVDSLLSWVATHDPPFHALIDRGALVRHAVLVAPCS